jgi:hypothetical protein
VAPPPRFPGPGRECSRPAGGNDREREPAEGQRGQHEPEVAQGDVVVLGRILGQQVDDDPEQPAGHEERADPRRDRDEEAGGDLNAADDVHEVLAAAGDDVVDPAGEIIGPVDGPVEELVHSEQDRRDGEGDPQQPERLMGGLADIRRAGHSRHAAVRS